MGGIGVDYALVLRRNLLQDNAGSHRIGVRLQFGGAAAAAAVPARR